jgi:hypothetical protein
MAESTRRDADLDDEERRGEALWISQQVSTSEWPMDPAQVEDILRLHRDYLAAPPPDEPGDVPEPEPASPPESAPVLPPEDR